MNLLPAVAVVSTNTSATVGPSGQAIRVFAVHGVSIPTATTLTFRNGTSASGTAYLQFDGAASQGVTLNINGGMRFPSGCYISTDVNLSFVSVVYTTEF